MIIKKQPLEVTLSAGAEVAVSCVPFFAVVLEVSAKQHPGAGGPDTVGRYVELIVMVHQLVVVVIVIAVVAVHRVLMYGALVMLGPLWSLNVRELKVVSNIGMRRRRWTPVRVALVRMVRVPRFVLTADQVKVVIATSRYIGLLGYSSRTCAVVELLLGANDLRLCASFKQWSGRPVEGMIAGLHLRAGGTTASQYWQYLWWHLVRPPSPARRTIVSLSLAAAKSFRNQ
uniref:Uncharacterized protein n=1 Tax=Anopheles culicifacies TaxID=139723 RepID=A0A182MC09_9DIPT